MVTMRKPLIAHVIYRLDTGGLENGLINIINRMPADRFDHAIIALTEFSSFRDRLPPQVSVTALHKKAGQDIGLYRRLYQTFRRLRPDILHTRNLSALEAQLPGLLAGIKYRIHGLHGWDINDLSGRNPKYRWLHRVLNPLIHRYIPLSRDLEHYLVNAVGVDTAKITRICNGVDTDRFAPVDPPHKMLLPEAFRDKLIIGTVGRQELVKDQLNLVNAYQQLLTRHPGLQSQTALLLVGHGSQHATLQQRVKTDGYAENVWFAGNRTDVPELMAAMDLFVLPSKAEGISNTVLEAMASGLPVVATAVGGNAELVVPQHTGLLVPKEDPAALAQALYQYLSQPAMLKAHGVAARQRAVDQFSLDKMVGEYQKVYQNQ